MNDSDKISKAVKCLGISFLLMVVSYLIVYAVGQNSVLVYLVVPFVLAFWGSSIYLTWLSYSKFMGVICVFSIIFPPAVFIIMLLSYSKASVFIKEKGMKLCFSGAVSGAE